MSLRENRWLTPPPHRTAYFWRARSPGRVLRVSSTRARVPARASTQREVAVATPDRWHARLSAVRSAVSRPRVGPSTRITTSPAFTRLPSGVRCSMLRSSPTTLCRTSAATLSPATTPVSRAAKSPTARASARMVASLVTSTPRGRSSPSAATTCA
jgi:hypothetical protein